MQEQADDYAPITAIGRVPIYLTEVLVALHLLSMVLASLWAGIFANDAWGNALIFHPLLVLGAGQIWRLLSYVILDFPPAGFGPVIWFLVGLLMLWWCGRQIEQFYGRKNFLKSYLLLTVIPPLIALLPGLRTNMHGPEMVHFGVFLMFAATYPGVQLMFGIPAKWLGWAFLFFNSLVYIANRSFPGMVWLWVSALTAYGLTRFLGRGQWLPEGLLARLGPQKPRFEVVRREREIEPEREELPDDLVSSIDPILDKIAKSGMKSLSAKEKAALQAASGELQRKESNH